MTAVANAPDMTIMQGARILIVDDEEHIRGIVTFDLEEFGATVFQAASGAQALAVLAKEKVDLVISDVSMPDGSGIDLLAAINALSPSGFAFVFMTGFADLTADEALHLGAEALLSKPLGLRDISAAAALALVPLERRWRDPTAVAGAWSCDTATTPFTLGRGGVYLGVQRQFPRCMDLIALDLPQGKGGTPSIRGVGRVRWLRPRPGAKLPAGIGVEFVHLEDDSRTSLVSYLKQARPKAFLPLF